MIQVERITDIIPELEILAEIHHTEIYPFDVQFDPDWERYKTLDIAEVIHVVTVRSKGKLVGYDINLVIKDMHHKNDLFAMNDSVYLHPLLRGSGIGQDMIEFSEKKLKELGVKLAHIAVKKDHDFSKLLNKMNYIEHESTYVKELN